MTTSPPCPQCGGRDAGIGDSRERPTHIHRRRVCPCGYRYTTAEVVVEAQSAETVARFIALTNQRPAADVALILALAESPVLHIVAGMEAEVRNMMERAARGGEMT